jgi:uncharacterized caspase-like protein
MRKAIFACVFLLGSIASAGAAAEKRVALVIGQNAYTALNSLKNPGIDAESMAATLTERGFDVISCDGKRLGCFDLTRDALSAAIAQLAAKSEGAALAFVFYAGHGMEAGDGNVLAPVDADIDCATRQVARGVLVDEVLEALKGAKQKIVVLDACRDNPLGEICPPATKAKLTFHQFKIPDAGNFLLVSSTKPGQVALDGLPGAHSPFARALFAALAATPNVHFDQVFSRVSKTVIEETAKANFTQIPEMLIRGGAPETCLAGEDCAADPQAAALRSEIESLKRDLARDQELGETARDYLSSVEKARGKPLSDDGRRVELAALKEAAASLAARNDNRGERALEKLKTGDTGEAERLFQEDIDAEAAEERAEAQRQAGRRKKAAASARNLAALARAKDVARAGSYYKRALELEPEDAAAWNEYASAAWAAGNSEEAKTAYAQAARIASNEMSGTSYWAASGQGDIAKQQGHLAEALQYFSSAKDMAEQQLAKANEDPEWRRNLSVSYNRIGHLHFLQGAYGLAAQDFQQSLVILRRLVQENPNNTIWQSDLAFTYTRAAATLASHGDLEEPLPLFQRSVTISERLVAADPKNRYIQVDLANSLEFVAAMQEGLGDFDAAAASHREQCDVLERLAGSDPGDARTQRDLSNCYTSLSGVLLKQGKLADAHKLLQDSDAIMQRIVSRDPSNDVWQTDLAMVRAAMARVQERQGDLRQALQSFRDAISTIERVAGNDPSNAHFQGILSGSYNEMAGGLAKQGDVKGSLDALAKSASISERFLKPDPGNAVWAARLCAAQEQAAALLAKQGNVPQAIKTSRACLTVREDAAKAHPGSTRWQEALVRSYAQLSPLYFKAGAAEKAKQLAVTAAEVQAEIAAAQEKAETAKEGKPGAKTAAALLGLSWYRLLAGDFGGALETSERAIAIRPEVPLYATNKAHALMFLGRAKEARALYLHYEGQPVELGGKLWGAAILADFQELSERGLKHGQIAEIKPLLARKGAPASQRKNDRPVTVSPWHTWIAHGP